MERWVGQTAVVTGAGSGIGAATAAALAEAGLRVVAVDIATENAITDYLSPLLKPEFLKNVIPKQVDVTDHKRLEELFCWIDKFGGVSVLVSCAGVMFPGQVTDVGKDVVSAEKLSRTLDVNTKGVILCAKFAVASMKKRCIDGHIVNINSLAGHYVPFNSHMNVYSASKHAITAFNGVLSHELADFNSKIKLTSISPGNTMTELASKSLEYVSKESNKLALQPSDVASAVLYALSTPPHININELTITSVGEQRL
ncbi:farnesol dehydrogenase-like [Leguminivora glycinivorella]|uniref:farnesol dehydrogenase-like n=1 Tax=Leguminivora glycinivorella TaxID=1035111 RepID=UPI0020106555|nr:farnesol dehydrogenase-like [Leguminivora glycinivorella]XP_047998937.1 farnesol dehydrogenase-like [Leguminivora glycinivorella]XP_047998938.1 farnesol dehydrogenase-like [Leguminivora glycinivorella]XP_047998939.1 farnesol dehydrogenase-like [Leguminivora glycinivorella]XP_047998940.1 farnesol dehydrogenase-like [Leguminivora glycinivorella]